MINIHTHTFLEKDVPGKFPNVLIKKFSETGVGYSLLKGALHNINPFTNKDGFDRLLIFIKEGRKGSQEQVFKDMALAYPEGTQFVVLTMDMHYMGAGQPKRPYIQQLYELDKLREKYPVLPFFHADCRRGNMYALFDEFVITKNWTGVKMYPPLGVFPYDPAYKRMYEILNEVKKPIISHCTYGNPVHYKGPMKNLRQLTAGRYDPHLNRKELCNLFTDPYNYENIAKTYPNIKIDLAHFGGSDNILKWYNSPNDEKNPFVRCKKLAKDYENIYVDISYTASEPRTIPIIKILMTDPVLRQKILFGSDYYMSLNKIPEIEWSINVRANLGEANWNMLQNNNRKFLRI